MIYAQIRNGSVVNAIIIDEGTPLGVFSQGCDYLIRIDELSPQPGTDWNYDGENFTRPPDPIQAEDDI